MHNAGGAATSVSGETHVATRCGRKGPDSPAALAKILSDLYKGEEEEFIRIKPRDGFSMYNPPSFFPIFPAFFSKNIYLANS